MKGLMSNTTYHDRSVSAIDGWVHVYSTAYLTNEPLPPNDDSHRVNRLHDISRAFSERTARTGLALTPRGVTLRNSFRPSEHRSGFDEMTYVTLAQVGFDIPGSEVYAEISCEPVNVSLASHELESTPRIKDEQFTSNAYVLEIHSSKKLADASVELLTDAFVGALESLSFGESK